jgi:6-phosphogluconolactonase
MHKLHIFPEKADLIEAVAQQVIATAQDVLSKRERFTIALAGGSTPRPLYELLASRSYRKKIEWQRVHLFWGDERCAPPDHPDSNYRMAKLALLDHISIPATNVHRIKGELDPHSASDDYRAQLQAVFGNQLPRFDVIIQGMGNDGHTASLFPNTAALDEQSRWVVPNYAEAMDSWRITLTYPVINNARYVIFLITGESKARALSMVLNGPDNPKQYPAQAVQLVDGELHWFVDEAAASRLNRTM